MTQETRRIAVELYINSNLSLRSASAKLQIPHMTLWRWVKWHREGGIDNLDRKRPYRKTWNRHPRKLEEKIMMLKEQNPSLTLKRTQEILKKEHITISRKGIWAIWRRYALTGRSKANPYAPFGPQSPESTSAIGKIKTLLKEKQYREAAAIANSLPSFPSDPILKEIPEEMLSKRRQLDQLFLRFGQIGFTDYYKKAKRIRKSLEKRGLVYSSILAGLGESLALNWMMDPGREIQDLGTLKQRITGIRNPSLRFVLSLHECSVHSGRLEGKGAKENVRVCTRLLRALPYPFYFDAVGSLLASNTDYLKAGIYFKRTIDLLDNPATKRFFLVKLAFARTMAGKYNEALRFLRKAEKEREGLRSLSALIRSYCAFGKGDVTETSQFISKALSESKSGNLRNHLHGASLGLAALHAALGDEKEARRNLNKYIPLFKKYGMRKEILIRNLLLRREILTADQVGAFPVLKLFYHLQKGKKEYAYKKAFQFAKDHGLGGFFHRVCVFFPEYVAEILKKGKPTGLPKSILNLPVFEKEIPVYMVKYLGDVILYKDQKYLPVKISPKDASFLIFLASTKNKYLSLEKIYTNFWPGSALPVRNLSHLLVRIRKKLKIPTHFLYIKENRLFSNCYFTTDYGEYTEHTIQAKALLQAGEWGFAKREFLQSFRFFRGEPFRKMYDDWSDDKRLEILFNFESDVLVFSKELLKRGKKEEADRILQKALKIVPYSDEIRNLLP
jgi:transposase